MDFTEIKYRLRFAIPGELYEIDPGQIVYFVPKKGLDQRTINQLSQFYQYLRKLGKNDDISLSIVPTDNELLIDTFAARNPSEVGIPYKVIVSTWDTIAGFASHFFDEDVKEIVERVPNFTIISRINISATNLPAIVEIDPQYRPLKKYVDIGGESLDDFGLEWLKKQPETETKKAEKVQQNEDKIRKILWECSYLGIDIDLKGLADAVEASNSKADSYQLSLKMEQNKTSGLIDCKIYVGEDMELNLKPIEKAVYLTFLTLKDGLVIEEAKPDFTKRIQNIYRLLPNRSEKEDGILHTTYIQPQTLREDMSKVNAAIARLIPYGRVGIEFAIEGEKNKPFKVLRSTPEIRKQIISAFNL